MRTRLGLQINGTADWEAAAQRAGRSEVTLLGYAVPMPAPGLAHVPLADEATRCLLLLAWPHAGRLAPYAWRLAGLARAAYARAAG